MSRVQAFQARRKAGATAGRRETKRQVLEAREPLSMDEACSDGDITGGASGEMGRDWNMKGLAYLAGVWDSTLRDHGKALE